jgi:hypothetical protein
MSVPQAPKLEHAAWQRSVPASACYWAILDTGSLGVSTPALLKQMVTGRSPALDAALERWLPLFIEQVHATYRVAWDQQGNPVVVACAVPRTLLEGRQDGALALMPGAMPSHLAERLRELPGPDGYNLLVGEFEPRVIAQVRRRSRLLATAAIVLLTGIAAFGLLRRAAHAEARAAATTRATEQIHAQLAPDAQTPAVARTRMTSELRRLKAAQHGSGATEQTLDAPAVLGELLARWPREAGNSGLYIKTQSIQVTSTGITVTVMVPAEAKAEPLIAALGEIPDWTLQQSQRTAANQSSSRAGEQPTTRLTLRLVPQRSKPLAGGAS